MAVWQLHKVVITIPSNAFQLFGVFFPRLLSWKNFSCWKASVNIYNICIFIFMLRKPDIRWCLRSREHRVTTLVWGHIMCRMMCSTCAHKLKTKINHANAQLQFPTRNSGYPGDWQIYSADQGYMRPPVSSPSEVAMLLMFWLLIQHNGDTSLNTLGTQRAKYQADHGSWGICLSDPNRCEC